MEAGDVWRLAGGSGRVAVRYLEGLGNRTRRLMCPTYIAGLIGPGDRKSIQPMAARADALNYDRLHHFLGAGIWDSAPLEADALVGGDMVG